MIRTPTVVPRWLPGVVLAAALLGAVGAVLLWRLEVEARRGENARSRALYQQLDRLCDLTMREFDEAKRAMSDESPIGLRTRPVAFERIRAEIDFLKELFLTCVPSAPQGAPDFERDARGLDLQLLSMDEINLAQAADEIVKWADWYGAAMRDAQKKGWAGSNESQRRDLLGPLDRLP